MSQSTLQFIYDGEVFSLDQFDPQLSVLNYCRENIQKTGTQEGCAEGDCGACTVVIAELNQSAESGIVFRPVNSCLILLPMIQGKALFTVESLTKNHSLHPVQQAMTEHHASQCGFCTPGFVMSLFWLYQSNSKPNKDEIEHCLSGNLCRCTGYKPIVDAALNMHQFPLEKALIPNAEQLKQQLLSIQTTQSKLFEANKNQTYSPQSIEALNQRKQQFPDSVIVAGNTDVGLWLNKQLKEIPQLLFINQIESLKKIHLENNNLTISAAVTLHDAFVEIIKYFPELADLKRRFASMPICQSGTLVGNIANGSPIGDSMPVLIALGASIRIQSARGQRDIALEDFYIDYQKKDLADDEWVESVSIPLRTQEQNSYLANYKISKRFDQDISAVCFAIFIILNNDGVIEHCRIVCGGMAAIPKRAFATEKLLLGNLWESCDLSQTQISIHEDYQPFTDLRASSDYRLQVTANLLKRFHAETTQESIVQLADLS